MTAASSPYHVAEGRIVFTYEPEGWPRGVLTGYEYGGGVFLEHVIVWPNPSLETLLRVLTGGIREAWARGYRFIAFQIHRDHPLAAGLKLLAQRFQFTLFRENPDGILHYVLWRRD